MDINTIGNWTQHSFLAQDGSTNDYKTALSVVGTPYNALCFNDGYHTFFFSQSQNGFVQPRPGISVDIQEAAKEGSSDKAKGVPRPARILCQP
jgi:hypothetical protein